MKVKFHREWMEIIRDVSDPNRCPNIIFMSETKIFQISNKASNVCSTIFGLFSAGKSEYEYTTSKLSECPVYSKDID